MKIHSIPWTLASASPRRLKLLEQAGLNPGVIPARIDEITVGYDPSDLVIKNARTKAESVIKKVESGILLAADTEVLVDDRVMGKPEDVAEAREILRLLSGSWHEVITGFCVKWIDGQKSGEGVEKTRVRFRYLTDTEIDSYVSSGEPFDKAGGYGIQEKAAVFVDRIEGCYFNVVGLPLARIFGIVQSWMSPADN